MKIDYKKQRERAKWKFINETIDRAKFFKMKKTNVKYIDNVVICRELKAKG